MIGVGTEVMVLLNNTSAGETRPHGDLGCMADDLYPTYLTSWKFYKCLFFFALKENITYMKTRQLYW